MHASTLAVVALVVYWLLSGASPPAAVAADVAVAGLIALGGALYRWFVIPT